MVLTGLREARHCDVAVTNSLDLEDTALFGDFVRRAVDSFEESEYLGRFSRGAPKG